MVRGRLLEEIPVNMNQKMNALRIGTAKGASKVRKQFKIFSPPEG